MSKVTEFTHLKNQSNPLSAMLADEDLRRAYHDQYTNSKRRGIEFNMSYEEWLMVWLASGKLLDRGRQAGQYCMCRYNDEGPYEIGNVFIQTIEENTKEAHKGRKKSRTHKMKLKKVLAKNRKHRMVEVDGVTYHSITEAAREHGISPQGVMVRCRSRTDKWKGWKLKEVYRGIPRR